MSKKALFPHGFPRWGEIYLVDFNRKKEKEINKIHPSLVVSSNLQNEHDRQIIVAPMSSEEELTIEEIKLLSVLTVPIVPSHEVKIKKPSWILLHRIRAVNKSKPRILEYLGIANPLMLKQVKKTLKIVLELE